MKRKNWVVLICGDRKGGSTKKIGKLLMKYQKRIYLLVEGGARGVDTTGFIDARLIGIPTGTFFPNWSVHKKAAGPIRNGVMLRVLEGMQAIGYEIRVWAFHKAIKTSKGTRNMVKIARKAGIPVKVFK